jgi:Holliday junction resolvase RusA-like endonuclease
MSEGLQTPVGLALIVDLCSKANSRKIVRMRGQWKSVKSKDALDAVKQIRAQLKPITPLEGPLDLLATVYYRDMRKDLDVSLLLDALQSYKTKIKGLETIVVPGIYKNDRQVVGIYVERRTDRGSPRVEALIAPRGYLTISPVWRILPGPIRVASLSKPSWLATDPTTALFGSRAASGTPTH